MCSGTEYDGWLCDECLEHKDEEGFILCSVCQDALAGMEAEAMRNIEHFKSRETRMPTEEELDDLLATVMTQYGELPSPEEHEQAIGHIMGAAITVCEDYITDGPGFGGKIMIVLWPAGWTEVFQWKAATPGLDVLETVYSGEGG